MPYSYHPNTDYHGNKYYTKVYEGPESTTGPLNQDDLKKGWRIMGGSFTTIFSKDEKDKFEKEFGVGSSKFFSLLSCTCIGFVILFMLLFKR